jgi:hypothetical protein
VLAPIGSWATNAIEARDEARFRAAREAALGRDQASDATELASLRADAQALLLSAANEALAGSLMQARLAEITQATGVRLELMEALPPAKHGTLVKLALTVRAHGAEHAVKDALLAIETASPLFTIERLTLRAAEGGVRVDMTVAGFWAVAPQAGSGE